MSDIYTKTVDKVFKVFHYWATGLCRPWLEAQLQAFCVECRKGRTFAYDFVDKETKNYYEIYHWSLGLKDEPVLPRRDPSAVEELTEEVQYKTRHENQMRGVLFRWWEKWASSLDALETSKPDFPLTSLLAEVSGIVTQEAQAPCPCTRTVAQLWSKVLFSGDVQEEFSAWFAASGLSEKSQTVERGRWTQDYFNNLPAEIRALFKQEAEAEKRQTTEMKRRGKQEKAELAGEGKSSMVLDGNTPRPGSLVPSTALSPEETAR
ncbi:hypothetical protein ARMSODRAFT_1021356 [Armillaria solidipes]|uniref:Uncharacterized protein n=1 Tax=Armillaria solidipes TaxID=1076256 RepID=A0A2H3B6L9_9AGAR|nr:hypothetical protein ARMSODRAFT_1021356 [Armillaria solidipes]